jgi:DNA (cytosine-5)-methyltransferase 1
MQREWQTPKGMGGGEISRSGDRKGEKLLAGQAKGWATPTAHDGRRPGTAHDGSTQGTNLARDAGQWATPMGRDWKDSADLPLITETNSHLGRQAQRTQTGGEPIPPQAVLNPLFVEALMGFPIGWTASAASETP